MLEVKCVKCYLKSMPRLARIDAPGVLHHVMGRGIERRKIFLNDVDRTDFINRLATLCQEGAMEVYAWVLMPNHFHILCKTKNLPLAAIMRRILTGYAVNFNKRHRRYGHLFQNRYKSIVCQEDSYLKELVRYIHLNQIRGRLVKDLKDLNENPWSGHSAILGKIKRNWQNTEYVLFFFGDKDHSGTNYSRYIKKGIGQGHRPELVGGGLIRSMGGWSAVLASRQRGERRVADQRILGDSKFVTSVISELSDRIKKNLRLSGQRIDIHALAERVSVGFDVSVPELRSGSRRIPVSEARRVLSWISVRELGYSGAEVARFLGVTNSCVTRTIAKGKRPDTRNIKIS
jgi:REP-associated tyrosine transposase